MEQLRLFDLPTERPSAPRIAAELLKELALAISSSNQNSGDSATISVGLVVASVIVSDQTDLMDDIADFFQGLMLGQEFDEQEALELMARWEAIKEYRI